MQQASPSSEMTRLSPVADPTPAGGDYHRMQRMDVVDGGSGGGGVGAAQQSKAFFGRLKYKYSGKNSEGNRFIRLGYHKTYVQ